MTQAALDQYALANGYGKTTQAMTEQEKLLLDLHLYKNSFRRLLGTLLGPVILGPIRCV